jgi:hypothetical protein
VRRNHFPLWRRHPETAFGYQSTNETAGSTGSPTPETSMRTFSFILAFAFVLAGPSLPGSSDDGLPGIGTFAYNGSLIAASDAPMVVAAR